MPSPSNVTADGDHIQFGEEDTIKYPPGFSTDNDAPFRSQYAKVYEEDE